MEKLLQLLKLASVLTMTVIGILAGLWWVTSWGGNENWARAQARAEEAGVSLDLADYARPEIPKEDDLLKDPEFLAVITAEGDVRLDSWARLYGTARGVISDRGNPAIGFSPKYRDYFKENFSEDEAQKHLEILAAPTKNRILRVLEILKQKPPQQLFDPAYDDDGESWSLIFSSVQNLSKSLSSMALIDLRSARHDGAFNQIKAQDNLQHFTKDPSLVSCLIEIGLYHSIDLNIWEGLRLRAWNDRQLQDLAKIVEDREFKKRAAAAYAFEAALGVKSLDGSQESPDIAMQLLGRGPEVAFHRFYYFGGPKGWGDHRKAHLVDHYLDLIQSIENDVKMPEQREIPPWSPLFGVNFGLSLSSINPNLISIPTTKKRLVLAMIAVERHFLANQSYPDSLVDLNLNLIDLTDPKERELAYELDETGRPIIWSRHEEENEERQKRRKLRWQFSPAE